MNGNYYYLGESGIIYHTVSLYLSIYCISIPILISVSFLRSLSLSLFPFFLIPLFALRTNDWIEEQHVAVFHIHRQLSVISLQRTRKENGGGEKKSAKRKLREEIKIECLLTPSPHEKPGMYTQNFFFFTMYSLSLSLSILAS